MLGVEIGEEFKIEGCGDLRFRLTKTAFMQLDADGWWFNSNLIMTVLEGRAKIIKLPKPILDDVEKKYLSNVIKPFRDDVKCIIKYSVDYVEWITICMKTCHDMDFPIFGVGTMYKGMELDREYSLEDLEL